MDIAGCVGATSSLQSDTKGGKGPPQRGTPPAICGTGVGKGPSTRGAGKGGKAAPPARATGKPSRGKGKGPPGRGITTASTTPPPRPKPAVIKKKKKGLSLEEMMKRRREAVETGTQSQASAHFSRQEISDATLPNCPQPRVENTPRTGLYNQGSSAAPLLTSAAPVLVAIWMNTTQQPSART